MAGYKVPNRHSILGRDEKLTARPPLPPLRPPPPGRKVINHGFAAGMRERDIQSYRDKDRDRYLVSLH